MLNIALTVIHGNPFHVINFDDVVVNAPVNCGIGAVWGTRRRDPHRLFMATIS